MAFAAAAMHSGRFMAAAAKTCEGILTSARVLMYEKRDVAMKTLRYLPGSAPIIRRDQSIAQREQCRLEQYPH